MSIPVCLSLSGRRVYIIGAGPVAYRKYQRYKQEGADICVIALRRCADFALAQDVTYIQKPFSWNLIEQNAFLIYAASDDIELNRSIVQEARKRQILCGCANQGMDCDIQSMAVWVGEQLQMAVSTKGSCPGADRSFLDQLSFSLTNFDQRTKWLANLRTQLLRRSMQPQELRDVLYEAAKLSTNYLMDILASIEGKRVLFLAFHGIANVQTIQETLDTLKQEIEQRFSNCVAIPVFLSEKIIMKAKKKGYAIESIQAITDLLDVLEIEYQIQPVLLQEGYWYDEVQRRYPARKIGKTLCEQQMDVHRILDAIQQSIPEGFLLGLYHPSDASLLKKYPIHRNRMLLSMEEPFFAPETEKPQHVFALTIFCGYHVEKDIVQKWLPYLRAHQKQVVFHKEGILTYPVCRELLYEKIAAFFPICDNDIETFEEER